MNKYFGNKELSSKLLTINTQFAICRFNKSTVPDIIDSLTIKFDQKVSQ